MTGNEGKKNVEYLFSILDYHHFTLRAGDQEIGHLVINTADHSIQLRSHDNGEVIPLNPWFNSYNGFWRWWKFQ